LTKKVGLMRYVYFVEGVVFVSLSILVARRGGLPAIIACSIVCSAMFSGAYGVRRISRYFNLPLGEVGWNWFRPMGRMLLFYLPVAVLVWWLPGSLPGIVRLAFNAALAVSVGGYFLLRYGIPLSFQDELLGRVPARFGSLLKHIFVQPAK
jgi:hypothetical protein